MDVSELMDLNTDLENIGKRLSQKEGALEQTMQDVKSLGFETIPALKKAMKRLESTLTEMEEEIQGNLEIIEKEKEKWEDE